MRRKTILALAAIWGIPDGWLIVGLVFIGFAVFLLCLAKYLHSCQPEFLSKIDDLVGRWGVRWAKTLKPYGVILVGFFLLYVGADCIREYRQILKDEIRTMGVVTKVDATDEGSDSVISLVFVDEQDVEHKVRTTWHHGILRKPAVHQRLPVIYYRPDPNLAVMDDFWGTFVYPWSLLLIGTCCVASSAVVLYRRVRIGTEDGGSILFRGNSVTLARLPREQSDNEIYFDDEEIDETPTVQSLITDLGDDDPRIREYAARELGQVGDKQAIKPLAKALKDEEQSIRNAAKESLVQVLAKTLDDEDPRSRATAATALGQIGGKRGIRPLAKALKDGDEAVRAAAKQGLARVQQKLGPDAWTRIVREMESRTVPMILIGIALQIIFAISPAAAQLRSRQRRPIRSRAVTTKVQPQSKQNPVGTPEEIKQKRIDELIKYLSDESAGKRLNAAVLLGEIGNTRAVEPLINALADRSSAVRMYAAKALEKIGGEEVVLSLSKLLEHEYIEVRELAASTLLNLGWLPQTEQEEAAVLISKKVTPDTDIERLVEIGSPAVPVLIRALKASNLSSLLSPLLLSSVRRQSAEALGLIGDARAVDSLIEALGDKESLLRSTAAEALGRIGEARAVEPLLEALRDKEETVRFSASLALLDIEDGRGIEALAKALGDKDPLVQNTALTALSGMSDDQNVFTHEDGIFLDEQAVNSLINKLKSGDPIPAVKTAVELSAIRSFLSIEALLKLAYSKGFAVRTVIEILEERGAEQSVDALIQLMLHSNTDETDKSKIVIVLGNMGDPRAIDPLLEVIGIKEMSFLEIFKADFVGNLETPPYQSQSQKAARTALEKIDGGREKLARIEEINQKNINRFNFLMNRFDLLIWVVVGIPIVLLSYYKLWRRPAGSETEEDSLTLPDGARLAGNSFVDAEEITEAGASQIFIDDLKSSDLKTRETAAMELGKIGDKKAIRALAGVLKDEEGSVRTAARNSLTQILIRTLSDKDPRARVTAAKTLGQVGGRRAVETLAKALKDEDQTVRTAARRSLAIIRNKLGPER